MVERLEAELVLDAHAELGEGPVWDATTRRLLWVDIDRSTVHRFDPVRGDDEVADVGQAVGAVASRADGGLVLALRDGFGFLDFERGELELVAPIEADLPGNRMNDGKCDRAGRFWAGSMSHSGDRPAGALYRLDGDLSVTKVLEGVTISNGIAWSPDDRLMYYIDSPTYSVDVFDYDSDSGRVANRRTLFEVSPDAGLPDGMTVDAEGLLWIAFWGGGAVRRYSPAGTLTAVVDLPVTLVTSCCFGGDELRDLFVTSASVSLTAEQAATEPHAGAVFRVRAEVPGLPPCQFGQKPRD